MNCRELLSTKNLSDLDFTHLHRTHLGISQLGAIAGLVSYVPPLKVYLEKIEYDPNKLAEDGVEISEAAQWGHIHEETIARVFSERTGKQLFNPETIYQHNEYEYILGTPDRGIIDPVRGSWLYVNEKGKTVCDEGLEIKTASEYNKKYWENENIPLSYELQARMYMHFFEAKRWWIACLIGGNRLEIRCVERDLEIEQYAIQIATNFWNNNVLKRIPPDLIGVEEEAELIASLYPDVREQTIKLDDEKAELIIEYSNASKLEMMYKSKKERAYNELKMLMGENMFAECGNNMLRLPVVETSRLDIDALKKEKPEIYEQYAKKSTFRRLWIKELKQGA